MKNLVFISLTIILSNISFCVSQSLDEPKILEFYVVDTVTINNPVVFYKSDQSGKFLSNQEYINKKKINLNRIILKDSIYLFSNSLYGFLSLKNFDKFNYPDFGNCSFKEDYFKNSKGVIFKEFKINPQKFIIALINVSYYDKKVTAYGQKRSIFNDYLNSVYYKIAFPFCE